MNTLISRKQSQVNVEMTFKIIHHILKHYRQYFLNSETYNNLLATLLGTTKHNLKNYFSTSNLILDMNMGDSMAIKECLYLHIELLSKYPNAISIPQIV